MIATAEAAKAIAAERIAGLLRSEAEVERAAWPNSTMALALTARELRHPSKGDHLPVNRH
jgi:hypothetical protein